MAWFINLKFSGGENSESSDYRAENAPATVMLAVLSISLNSGASPETSQRYDPVDWALSCSNSRLQMN